MNLKQVALKGAVVLAIVIALCMFFSQTILTITTAKVKLVTTKHGKLEQTFTLSGELYYASSEAFTIDAARDLPAVVVSLYVRAGDEVKAGDLLFTTRLLPACDDALQKAEEEYQKALDQHLKTSMENSGRSMRDTGKNEAERALTAAREDLSVKRGELISKAHDAGLELSNDVKKWRGQIEQQNDGALTELLAAVEAAEKAERGALDAFLSANRKSGDNTSYSAVKKIEEEQAAVDKALQNVMKVRSDMENVRSVRATRDGVIVSLDVKPGENCPADRPAYTLAASTPVLRADISDVRKEITKDMKVEVSQEYGTLKTRVVDIKRESAAIKYATIEITDEMLREFGGYRGLSGEKVTLKITYTAKTATSLLPDKAVRGEGSEAHVLVVEDQNSFWGQQKKVRKQSVHIIERSDTQCSIEEELWGQSIADGEDRSIQDGSSVMEYLTYAE